MRPPMHPHHVEYIGSAGNKEVYWTCSCGHVGTYRRLVNVPPGQPTIARLMADEMNAHRATYVDPLMAWQVEDLPDGSPITVTWSGGNGPHRYVLHVDDSGRYAWDGVSERLLHYNPLIYVGTEKYHTRVWA